MKKSQTLLILVATMVSACALRTGSSAQQTEVAAGQTKGAPTAVAAFLTAQAQAGVVTPQPTKTSAAAGFVNELLATPGPSQVPVPTPFGTPIGVVTTVGKWLDLNDQPGVIGQTTVSRKAVIAGGLTLPLHDSASADHWYLVEVHAWMELRDLATGGQSQGESVVCTWHTWGHDKAMCHGHIYADPAKGTLIGFVEKGVIVKIVSVNLDTRTAEVLLPLLWIDARYVR